MNPWWLNEGLNVDKDRLVIDGNRLSDLAVNHGTPLYVYSRATIQRQLDLLKQSLANVTDNFMIYYAMKANRFSGVLDAVHEVAGIGVDTCSPNEVALALHHGFPVESISFTSSMLSNRDLEFAAREGVYCVLDSFSALRRYGEMVPEEARISLRLDPGASVAYRYSESKFGFEFHELDEALKAAFKAGLCVDGLHIHIGWNLANTEAGEVERAFKELAVAARKVPRLRVVNIGGGLGGQYRRSDRPLELSDWAQLIDKHLAPLEVTIACEPGTYVTRSAGVLIVEVNTVEERRGIHWVGVDAGFAVNSMAALYQIPLEVVPTENPLADDLKSYSVVGHMNDAVDVWSRQCALPPIEEGDFLAFYPCGAYGSSMRSDHCMRGEFQEVMV